MSPASDTPVRLRGVCKQYGSTTAVSQLDLEVHTAEVLALLGPNGAGKTTTVEMCEGFVRPDAGTIEVLGLDPIADNARLRARIGVMLQGGGGYPAARAGEMLNLVASYAAHPLDPQWLLDTLGLTDAARTGARELALEYNSTDPCDAAVSQTMSSMDGVANLPSGDVTPSFATASGGTTTKDYCGSVSGTGCTSTYVYNKTCNSSGAEVAGDEATITVKYPYTVNVFGMGLLTINLSTESSDAIEGTSPSSSST